jgi:predicted nucleotide-binding protein
MVELTREVDFAAFVFAHDDWTRAEPATTPDAAAAAVGQAAPRDNVVFEAGLFGDRRLPRPRLRPARGVLG